MGAANPSWGDLISCGVPGALVGRRILSPKGGRAACLHDPGGSSCNCDWWDKHSALTYKMTKRCHTPSDLNLANKQVIDKTGLAYGQPQC